ncbi:Npun_F0296 family exosortase-dependent surface protein [Glacieibacterium frigidum]|uniref:PEP-CTERM sorting domain-containing protein n=1 Tax=Glacieibacterium frigidum TaxID=2593303 RepID=A0A552UFP4_9SPHN|nr:PEPxxWA-CTERM sorting domain-containing protein [Glacieibacterium frigidum]TRW17043.1 PEP-CTERM sorting domain-containing protein [Glacieibacterium frigidum]
MTFKSLALAAALFGATAAQAVTIVTVEAPGLVSTTRDLAVSAVEDFDAQPTGGSVVPVNTSFAAIGVTGIFTSTQILAADQYTGADGVGNGVAVRETGDLEISFTGTPLDYFGVWASALDANNTVSFYNGTTLLSSTNLTAFPLSGAYSGNPSGPFAGANGGEKYAFFNFHVTEGFNRVVLSQNGGGGFELDNITIGATVPEPAAWAMMITGFGLVGLGMRRRMPVVTA